MQALASNPGALSNEEIRRYSRHIIMPEVGVDGQRLLKASSVLLIGTGGLGSPLALYLAAAGIGRLGLVDYDVVDESNLQRQIIHGPKHHRHQQTGKRSGAHSRHQPLHADRYLQRAT